MISFRFSIINRESLWLFEHGTQTNQESERSWVFRFFKNLQRRPSVVSPVQVTGEQPETATPLSQTAEEIRRREEASGSGRSKVLSRKAEAELTKRNKPNNDSDTGRTT